ncbi:MAG: preprotein translocase subunit YajC [Candidatus Dadabacteria bacterium]|nr:preprotein translocase subunit YajC [Candidatus Dadabacteria bacterium]MCY4262336.1 preprotein translocase subunit YajC [Candidatus Dadabacteria bacterium]
MPPGTGQGAAGGSAFSAILPFIIIFALFYFLIIRPQQRQSRERKNMLAEVKRGDSVITTGGMHGRVISVDGDDLTVEIAKGVNIRMVRSGISEKTDSAADGKSKGGD